MTAVTLTEFLLARIAEDEEAAKAAGGEFWYPAVVPGETMRKSPDEPTRTVIDSPASLVTYEVCSDEKGAHIARHDPARVLAECEAKRRIVEAVTHVVDYRREQVAPGRYNVIPIREPYSEDDTCEEVLRLLALPDADHPDYDERWRP